MQELGEIKVITTNREEDLHSGKIQIITSIDQSALTAEVKIFAPTNITEGGKLRRAMLVRALRILSDTEEVLSDFASGIQIASAASNQPKTRFNRISRCSRKSVVAKTAVLA